MISNSQIREYSYQPVEVEVMHESMPGFDLLPYRIGLFLANGTMCIQT